MRESSNKKLRDIAYFFDELSKIAQTEPLESVLDKIIGSHIQLVAEFDEEDDYDMVNKKQNDKNEFVSPFREYYFGIKEFQNNTANYLTFLSSLRMFIHSLREYKNGEKLTIDDLVEFAELHKKIIYK